MDARSVLGRRTDPYVKVLRASDEAVDGQRVRPDEEVISSGGVQCGKQIGEPMGRLSAPLLWVSGECGTLGVAQGMCPC